MNSLVKNIIKKGIAKGQSELLSDGEIKELENLILKNKLENIDTKGVVVQNIVGIDNRIDELLKKILANPEIQILCKVWIKIIFLNISARYNVPEDKGLALHQDANGEFSLMILLNDQLDGSTFFPGTQLIPSNSTPQQWFLGIVSN